GYKKSAPLAAAKNLHGKLLLIHGAIDDNVHMSNTIQFIYELQKAGKQIQFMVYPKSRHGVTDPVLVKHMRQMMLDYVLENLYGKIQQRSTMRKIALVLLLLCLVVPVGAQRKKRVGNRRSDIREEAAGKDSIIAAPAECTQTVRDLIRYLSREKPDI